MNRMIAMAVMGLMLHGVGGCNVAGYVADVAAGGETPVSVTAEYAGLRDQSAAVLVSADMAILYRMPQAQLEIAAAVSRELAGNVSGIRVVDAREVVAFQTRNIYWDTMTPAELGQRLNVARLVRIDLEEYRLNEPGNTILFRGVIGGRISVIEADGERPNDAVYSTIVTAAYPPDSPQGVADADPLTIRKGVLDRFARRVAWKFYDHEELRSELGAAE